MKEKLVAFIRETSFLDANMDLSGYVFEHGTHNGYVAVPPENRYHGRSWEDMEEEINVHGGITFSEPVTYPDKMNDREIREEYIGKRNAILGKAEFITENTEIGDDWWIFGFDTAHWGDDKYNWDRKAVIDETLSLMEQLNHE